MTYKTWSGAFHTFSDILNRYERDGWNLEDWRVSGSGTYAVFVKYEGES